MQQEDLYRVGFRLVVTPPLGMFSESGQLYRYTSAYRLAHLFLPDFSEEIELSVGDLWVPDLCYRGPLPSLPQLRSLLTGLHD